MSSNEKLQTDHYGNAKIAFFAFNVISIMVIGYLAFIESNLGNTDIARYIAGRDRFPDYRRSLYGIFALLVVQFFVLVFSVGRQKIFKNKKHVELPGNSETLLFGLVFTQIIILSLWGFMVYDTVENKLFSQDNSFSYDYPSISMLIYTFITVVLISILLIYRPRIDKKDSKGLSSDTLEAFERAKGSKRTENLSFIIICALLIALTVGFAGLFIYCIAEGKLLLDFEANSPPGTGTGLAVPVPGS